MAALVPLLLAVGGVRAQPAPPGRVPLRVIAVAPFADDAGMQQELARWSAFRLNELLEGAGIQTVPIERAQRALSELGRTPSDRLTLAAAADLGRRLGADAVISGRLMRATREPRMGGDEPRVPTSTVILELRVLTVADRRVVLQTEVFGERTTLPAAADAALRDFVRQLSGVR